MNMNECPHCGSKTYKEIYDDGMARLICQNLQGNCQWQSALMNRHSFLEVKTMPELKDDWA